MNRKTFLKKSVVSGGLLLTLPTILVSQDRDTISSEEIKEFVTVGHGNYEKTKKMVEDKPLILNCSHQWKRGDFETAIGGACHVGSIEVAKLLVSKGARMDIFNYAFLGYTDFVIKQVQDFPPLLTSPGPHGLTLLHHARVGENKLLEEWLLKEGLTETHDKDAFG